MRQSQCNDATALPDGQFQSLIHSWIHHILVKYNLDLTVKEDKGEFLLQTHAMTLCQIY